MKLHHFHVADRRAGAKCHRDAVHGLVGRGRRHGVHCRPAACGQQHRLRLHGEVGPTTDVLDQRPRDSATSAIRQQVERAVFLNDANAAPHDLLREPVDDLDAGEIALVHRAIEGLARERFLMKGVVRVAIEEAPELVLEVVDASRRLGDERPDEFLVVQKLACVDRVLKVPLVRVVLAQHDVVAALDEPRTPALSERSLDHDGDVERRVGVEGMQGRKETGSAAAEDENVGPEHIDVLLRHVSPRSRYTSRIRLAASSRTCAYKLPPCESIATVSGPSSRVRSCQTHSGMRSSRYTASMASIWIVWSAAAPPTMAR